MLAAGFLLTFFFAPRYLVFDARMRISPTEQGDATDMLKKKPLFISLLILGVLLFAFFAYRHWRSGDSAGTRNDLLSFMPSDSSAVGFLDLSELRSSPFLQQLLSWAPQVAPDSDYAQFVQATGFDYERDLDRVVLAFDRQAQSPWVFAVAEGRFNRKKIEAYAARFGSLKTADGKTLFAVPIKESKRKAYFTFLRDDRIAWANDSSYFFQRPPSGSPQAWREHLSRVAGTPIFAVLQQDSVPASALAKAPGGFRSPQLATLLGQLQWISISGKPDGNLLRVVVDGESLTETTTHQLKDLLSGLLVLAQVGLNDTNTRKQLDPNLRQGYLDLLQSADIQLVDRGTSKSVRVIFEITPKLLQTPGLVSQPTADPPPASMSRNKKQAAQH